MKWICAGLVASEMNSSMFRVTEKDVDWHLNEWLPQPSLNKTTTASTDTYQPHATTALAARIQFTLTQFGSPFQNILVAFIFIAAELFSENNVRIESSERQPLFPLTSPPPHT